MNSESIRSAVETARADSPAGTEALFCACALADAPVPFEMAIAAEGAMHNPALINPAAAMFAVAATLDPVCRLGLVEMDHATGTFNVPQQVRRVILDDLDPDERAVWQARALHALSLAVPDADPGSQVPEALAPHVAACVEMVREGLATPDANRILHQYGFLLHFAQRHAEAVEYLEAALAVDKRLKPETHPDIASDLEGLAAVLAAAGEHKRAVEVYRECLALFEKGWTENNRALIPVLAGLALSLRETGEKSEADEMARRTRELFESHFGDLPVEPDGVVADCLKMN